MNDLEIRQWDKRLMDQARQGWENYKHLHIDLDTARTDQSYLIAGEYLYVEQSSSADAIAKIKLNRNSNDALDLEKGVKIETVFIEIFITNDALQGEWLDLVFGINFKYKKKIALDYVDRGNLQLRDFAVVDFTIDGNWHDLDLSGIVPPGAKLILIRFVVRCLTADNQVYFVQSGYTTIWNLITISTLVDNKTQPFDAYIDPGRNRILEYMFSAGVWPDFYMNICGWFI